MLDTMTLTKIVGALCGSLLIFLFGVWAAESIYHVGGDSHDGEVVQAYVIDTGESDVAGEVEEGPDFATLYAAADAGKGERVFGKCKACHKVDGTNAAGPHLDGVVDRAVDAVDGYSYSGALEKVVDVWTPENLSHFLEDPRSFAPGTKMTFSGLSKAEDRANLIAWLATQS